MRRLPLLFVLSTIVFTVAAQPTAKEAAKEAKEAAKEAKEAAKDAAKVAISNTGCTLEVFCLPGRFDVYDLEDGSTVYADDCMKDGITWGVYCVQLKKPISNLAAAEDTILAYLDFLKLDYGIVRARGYEKGHRLNKEENTRGVSDSWEDADKNNWKIKAWTNGSFICVLHVHGAGELPEKRVEVFLEGLRFPGMKGK
jgi:hypothetical protein